MDSVSLRTDFGSTKSPRVFLWLFITLALIFSSPTQALIRNSQKQCLLIFATDPKSENWSIDSLMHDYLKLDFFSRDMKEDFIREANRIIQRGQPREEAIYLDIENAWLKTLNDRTNDKMLVTSVTNLHKRILHDAIIRLIRNNSNIVTLGYSDFKSMRFKFQFRSNSLVERLYFKSTLMQLFEQINADYIAALEKIDQNYYKSADLWFRGGVGETADEANIAARASREKKTENHLMDFNSADLQTTIWKWQQAAEDIRMDLVKSHGRSPLFSADGFLTADVIDVIRKSANKKELVQRIKKKYRVELLDAHASKFKRYLENVDRFAPGIYVVERLIATLEPADLGGLSADFAGLGAKNLEATARALAGAKDIEEVLMRARKNEQLVTIDFQRRLKEFDQILKAYYSNRTPSGDDFVGYGDKVVSFQNKLRLMDQIARMEDPSSVRIAFIAPGVKHMEDGVSHRGLLAAHGESIEKELRKSLEGEIPTDVLKQITFGLDMLGSRAGEGGVQLLIGQAPGLSLTKDQMVQLKSRFNHVVLEFNGKEENSVSIKKYVPANVVW